MRLGFLALAVTLQGALATVAHVESFSVDVPFAFLAGGKSFTAGAYTVDSVASGVVVIRGAGSSEAAAVLVSPAGYSDTAKTGLIFERTLEMQVLTSVKLNNGLTVMIVPAKRMTAGITMARKGVALTHP
ncbi:MAG: hypothetical protein ABI833_05440 [Acidobacteriota bacterium]